jgi:hypothetical protein
MPPSRAPGGTPGAASPAPPIYHLQARRGYPALTQTGSLVLFREDAQAAGFHMAYNCRSSQEQMIAGNAAPLMKKCSRVAGV